MTTDTDAAPDKLAGEAAKADAGMARLQEALRRFAEGDCTACTVAAAGPSPR
jgi:hypothetical protein